MRALHLGHTVTPLLLLLLLAVGSAAAEGVPPAGAREPGETALSEEGQGYGGDERVVETLEQKGGQVGYNFLAVESFGGRAREYSYLHSSRSGGLFYRTLEKDGNFELEGNFLNENDYQGDLLLDYQGDYRLHLRTESLFHNLDRELLFSPNFQAGRTDAPTPADYIASQDPPHSYGVSVTQDLAEFRYRLHNYPMHVNLGYWRLVREGVMQQRFADAAFEGTPNTIYATPRRVQYQTQEGRLGLDAHLGWVDVSYDLRVRVFEDRKAIPVASFVPRSPEVVGGVLQHNEDPESRYISHTVKLHNSLDGGVVASASYSIDQRENLSRLADTRGAKHREVNLQNVAGDFVYTPCKEFSLALKYRRQEQSYQGNTVLSSVNFSNPLQVAKLGVDSSKDVGVVTLSFKPARELSLTGEYRGELVNRSRVSDLPTIATWGLPETSSTQKGSLALLYRPAKGMRLSAKYSYAATDHPSYGNSFEQKHQGELLATYTGSKWGASANLVARQESNGAIRHPLVNFPFTDPISFSASDTLSRDRATENANLSAWLVPMERVTLAANYAYLHTSVDQGVLFAGVAAGQADPGHQALANFTTRSHVYGVSASFAASDRLDLSFMLQQVRSSSLFAPQLIAFTGTSNTLGISGLTEQDTIISSASARGELRLTSKLTSSLEYSWSDYHEKNPVYSESNGTVNSVLAYLTAKW